LSVIAAVDDLFFSARIQETARLAGVALETVATGRLQERLALGAVNGVILDLSSPAALELVRALKARPQTRAIPLVGFVSHVAGDVVAAARKAGCDRVLARSAFTKELAELLPKLARSPLDKVH
jgi:CheY-like chemotaxis protein